MLMFGVQRTALMYRLHLALHSTISRQQLSLCSPNRAALTLFFHKVSMQQDLDCRTINVLSLTNPPLMLHLRQSSNHRELSCMNGLIFMSTRACL